ncbi:hypothetical protein [Pararhizobium sp.]|uniref:hypothetical protein n=1 Tax=Pararhizobium sp. TaxID=1977563 RepID=UPI003D0EA9E4
MADLAIVDAKTIGARIGIEVAGVERQQRKKQEGQQQTISDGRRAFLHVQNDQRHQGRCHGQQRPAGKKQRMAIGEKIKPSGKEVVPKSPHRREKVDRGDLAVENTIGCIKIDVVIPVHRTDWHGYGGKQCQRQACDSQRKDDQRLACK